VRNDIVHESKSLSTGNARFVDLAIGSVFYFYKFVAKSQNYADFFLELEIHYNSIKELVLGRDLSIFEEPKEPVTIKTIENFEDMDKMMEETFKLSEEEKKDVNANLLESFF